MTDLVQTVWALNGDRTVPPQSNDPNGFASFNQGYTPNYELDLSLNNNSAHPVERQDMNYLFYLLTSGLQEFQQFGFSAWFSTMPSGYSKGAVVRRRDVGNTTWNLWESLVDNNSVDPNASNQTSWSPVQDLAQSLLNIAMPTGGGVAANEVFTSNTDFNTFNTTSGTYETASDAVASGSSNSPSAYSGMLEVKVWTNGGNTFIAQQYRDRQGNAYGRGAVNGTWSAWSQYLASANAGPIIQALLGNMQQGIALSSATTVTVSQAGTTFKLNPSAPFTVTLPTIASFSSGTAGKVYEFINSSATYTCTIASGTGGDLFAPTGTLVTSNAITLGPLASVRIVLCAGGWFLLSGTVPWQNSFVYTRNQFDSSALYNATTQFVQQALGNRPGSASYSATTTLTSALAGQLVIFTGSTAAQTLSIPAQNAMPTATPAAQMTFVNTASVNVTVSTQGSDLFVTPTGTASNFTLAPGQSVDIVSTATNRYTLAGPLAAYLGQVAAGTQIYNIVDVMATPQTCVAGNCYVNNTGSAVNYIFPTTPTQGQVIEIIDFSNSFTSTVTVGSVPVTGISGTLTMDLYYIGIKFRYDNSTEGWVIQ